MTRADFEELINGFDPDRWWCITGGFARDLLSNSRTGWRKDLDFVALKEDAGFWTEYFSGLGMSVRQKSQWPIRENVVGENFVYEKTNQKIDGWFIDSPEPTQEIQAVGDLRIRVTTLERMGRAKALFAEDQNLFGKKFHDLPEELRNRISTASKGAMFYKQGDKFEGNDSLSPWALARNASTDLMGWAQGGFRLANKETQEKRIAECSKCEFHKNSRCLKCGCFTQAKVKLLSSRCPLGRWS